MLRTNYLLPPKLKIPFFILSLLIPVTLTACQDHNKAATTPAAQKIVQAASSSSSAAGKPLQPKGFDQRSSCIGSELPTQSQISSARAAKIKFNAGEDPEFARRKGWPKKYPTPLAGSIVPQKRIVAYYGNPLSKRMGALGEFPKDEMLKRLKAEVVKWEKADPNMPVQPALHLIAVVAQGAPGKAGKYRLFMTNDLINQVYGWAKEAGAVLFIDIQTGHDDIRTVLPQFEWILKNPDVHLGIDPEFNLISSKAKPGKKIGTYDAADINFASNYLKDLVQKYKLPPKVFVVHRFTRNGVTNADKIVLRREVQIVMHMDGWGAPWLKRDSYKDYIVAEPVQFTGFKLFYHNDTKKGDPLMIPQDLLKLNPKPVYIQYQ